MNVVRTVVTMHAMHHLTWLTTHSFDLVVVEKTLSGLMIPTFSYRRGGFSLMFLYSLETCFNLWRTGELPIEVICCCTLTEKLLKHCVFWNWSSYPTTILWFWLLWLLIVFLWPEPPGVLFIYQDAASYTAKVLMRCLVPVNSFYTFKIVAFEKQSLQCLFFWHT